MHEHRLPCSTEQQQQRWSSGCYTRVLLPHIHIHFDIFVLYSVRTLISKISAEKKRQRTSVSFGGHVECVTFSSRGNFKHFKVFQRYLHTSLKRGCDCDGRQSKQSFNIVSFRKNSRAMATIVNSVKSYTPTDWLESILQWKNNMHRSESPSTADARARTHHSVSS